MTLTWKKDALGDSVAAFPSGHFSIRVRTLTASQRGKKLYEVFMIVGSGEAHLGTTASEKAARNLALKWLRAMLDADNRLGRIRG